MAERTRLPLVAPGEELAGAGPIDFERLCRAVHAGSLEHRGLITLVATLARQAVVSSVPPSAAATLLSGLDGALSWAAGTSDDKHVRSQRTLCFAALPVVERATVVAVRKAQALGSPDSSPLGQHADQVVLRYASLAAHFSTSAVCHTLDAVETAAAALEVPRDVAGARAYQLAGLGAARNPEFRARALAQAEWEAGRDTSRSLGHQTSALAPQIFHEYLGARWRMHAAAERASIETFIAWALTGRRTLH